MDRRAVFLPADWEVAVDPNSGRPYYFNRVSGETSWEPPPMVAAANPAPQAYGYNQDTRSQQEKELSSMTAGQIADLVFAQSVPYAPINVRCMPDGRKPTEPGRVDVRLRNLLEQIGKLE
jgi:hypothetical protein